ncbi:MAG: ribosome biogenesis GTPase Der [Ignavibacteriales bacterium]|jgi:GTP-binding protein|nr:ribosome biogenesis GTPase Der [Ignavibacteriales bacterium]MBK7266758.1 ribosome biogenesis GTPase Der [Ignavibacteriales bacterium]MBK8660507.1 ribosome biogenesis GTPase Der [Ignavibacteriales bacterium]MBP9122735.1 ribosome biogenesis GTPase Der [Ignavibacteriaceae bacterium]MCC6636872.1 ribosome biogenesis GTPase Der [Ignavibacteriaceae bacterium]
MRDSLVVIVGRPNVGKSTLFNRLTGTKDAIVDDVSGVTRDRQFGFVEWNMKRFRLIDTGGYVPNSPDQFEAAIREQVEIALTEADKIIFVLDGRTGLLPIDETIAELLRSSGKKTVLCVNKIDSEKFQNNVHEFYRLGFGEPHPISALNGRMTGDFLDIIIEEFPLAEEEAKDEELRIAFVGRPNVGKSSLTNALLGEDRSIVTDIPGTTRDSIDSVIKFYGEEITIVDTAGLRKKSRIKENIEYYSSVRTLRAIADSNIVVLLVDAVQGFESQEQKILEEAIQRRKGVIIAINKWDLVEKDSNTAKYYEKALIQKLGKYDYFPFIFISALTKQRIFKLIEMAKEIQIERHKKVPTSELNDIMLKEIQASPPQASHTGKEVKIKFVTQVGDNYPVFLFFCNYPKEITDQYRRYLEKVIRRHFGFKGVPFTISFKEK